MSKFHNILDASTLAKKYHQETGWDIIQSLFRQKDCTLHILNITIPEIVGAFVRWELKSEIGQGKWEELKNLFIADITNYQLVIHNVTHRNIIQTDDVWKTSMPIKPTQYQGKILLSDSTAIIRTIADVYVDSVYAASLEGSPELTTTNEFVYDIQGVVQDNLDNLALNLAQGIVNSKLN